MTVRAIEHIGITVPDLEQATAFFAAAFGAEHLYDMIDGPLSGPAIEAGLGVPPGATIEAIRMPRLGNGPNLELFVYSGVPQRDPVVPSYHGLQHVTYPSPRSYEATTPRRRRRPDTTRQES